MTVTEAILDGMWPSARWDEAIADVMTLRVIVSRIAEGEALREVCRSRGWPYSHVARWLSEDDSRRAEYEWALRLWADAVAQETLGVADGADAESVGVAKLRIETRMRLAARWDRERYGERSAVDVRHGGNVTVMLTQFALDEGGRVIGSHQGVTPVSRGTVTELDAPEAAQG